MKKYLYVILVILTSNFNSSAQNYHPLLDSINHWYFASEYLGISPETPCTYPYRSGTGYYMFADDDTTISSVVYKKLVLDGYCTFGYLREDTSSKKVFFTDILFNTELLYDFNMQVGDTISRQFDQSSGASYWLDGVYRLDSIDSVSTMAGYRKRFHLNCITTTSQTLSWVEGIGNLAHPVYTKFQTFMSWIFFAQYCPGYPHNVGGGFVSCYSHAQKVYFDSCAYNAAVNNVGGIFIITITDSCIYTAGTSHVDELDFSSSVKIKPNPFHSQAELVIENKKFTDGTVEIIDINGRCVYSKYISQVNSIIDRNSLSNGIYMYRIKGENGMTAKGKFVVY